MTKREKEQMLRRILPADVAESVLEMQAIARALRRDGRVRKRKVPRR